MVAWERGKAWDWLRVWIEKVVVGTEFSQQDVTIIYLYKQGYFRFQHILSKELFISIKGSVIYRIFVLANQNK